MDWWKKALATFSSTAIFFWGVHFWNESYRKKGETHPITAWLEQYVSIEEEDRKKRIDFIERESLNAERRLYALHRWFPNLRSRSHLAQIVNEKDDEKPTAAAESTFP